MSKQANPTTIGAFVIGAVALAVAGVIALGSVNLFADTRKFTVFFEGSVAGLYTGSPVKALGVDVGEVVEIRAVADANDWTIYTETILEVDTSRFVQADGGGSTGFYPTEVLVENGIRARLETQSLLTGQLYVSIDFLPSSEARLLSQPVRYPQIPALPTRFQEAENTFRSIAEKLENVPLDEVFAHLTSVLAGVDQFINGGKLDSVIASLDTTLAGTQAAMADGRKFMRTMDSKVGPLATQAESTLAEAEKALASLHSATDPSGSLLYQTQLTLQEMQEAARALRLLAGYLERNPNSVVFGRSGEEK